MLLHARDGGVLHSTTYATRQDGLCDIHYIHTYLYQLTSVLLVLYGTRYLYSTWKGVHN